MSHTSSPPPSTRASSPTLPWCLVGDRGYDSDGLDDLLMTQYGIEMIAANRRGRAKTQDGRPLRRAKRRWKIERLFAWLHNCRRVVTRWERHVGNYLGMVQLACARILLRAFMRSLLAAKQFSFVRSVRLQADHARSGSKASTLRTYALWNTL